MIFGQIIPGSLLMISRSPAEKQSPEKSPDFPNKWICIQLSFTRGHAKELDMIMLYNDAVSQYKTTYKKVSWDCMFHAFKAGMLE